MEIVNVHTPSVQTGRIRLRSVLTEFVLMMSLLVALVIALSQWTMHEAASRYGIMEASYWDTLPYQTIPVTQDGRPTKVGAADWSGDRQRIYENGVGPRYADFTLEHKIKGAVYLVAEYASPYGYTVILLGGGLFLFYRRRIKKPLRLLIESAERVAAGELDFRVSLERRDEFGQIAEAFERMRYELERSSRQMWQVAEQRRRLNAAFAHDLRTPVAVLRGRLDLLADFYPTGQLEQEEVLSSLAVLRRHTERLERYTASMSTVQKLEDLEVDVHPIEVMELTEELSEIAETLRGSHTLKVSPILPAVLTLDIHLVTQVFENLMTNAQRFAAEEIQIHFDHTPEVFSISVRDDGPGFSPEALSRAVEPYYRGQDVQADIHFGLGLYICRLLCEKHGGSLTLNNAWSGGAEVTAEFRSLAI